MCDKSSESRLCYITIFQHGRVKVRSTAEQEEIKKKEREEKVRVYRKITSRIYEKVCSCNLLILCALQIVHVMLTTVMAGS